MTQNNYYAVLDSGTTAVKALIFDGSFKVIARSSRQLIKNFPGKNLVEQDPYEILKMSVAVLQEALIQANIPAKDITSLGITNQRETIVAWDSTTGESIHPAIVWEDTRTGFECAKLWLFGKQKLVRSKTGLALDPYFSATKISWLLKHVPAAKKLLQEKKLRVGTIDTWLLWHLTETHEYKTDLTNACRTLLCNINTRTWDTELFKLFDVPEGLMATIEPSQGSYGNLHSGILGAPVPIRAVCGDQQASMYAAGISPLTTKITYGTGAFLMQIIGEKPEHHPPFFTTLVPGEKGRSLYALEAKVGECGSRVTPALGSQEALEKVFTEISKEVNIFVKKLPNRPEKIIADGGAIRNVELVKIQSKTSDIPVVAQSIFDGTALGVAKLLASA